MAAATPLGVLTLMAVWSGDGPAAGSEVTLSCSDLTARGRLIAIDSKMPDVEDSSASTLPPHWSRLAAVDIEMDDAAINSLLNERTSRVDMLREPSQPAIAVGLAIGRKKTHREDSGGVDLISPGFTVWLTGLSGAGKTTIAGRLEQRLLPYGRVEMLDADLVRTHICKGLGFTHEDRVENVRRLAVLARLLSDAGAIVLVSAISPYRTARSEARSMIGRMIEVFVNAPLSVCEDRDVKGLYRKARRGEIQQFTGIDDPYEPPSHPEVECRTDMETIDESTAKVMAVLSREIALRPAIEAQPLGSPSGHAR